MARFPQGYSAELGETLLCKTGDSEKSPHLWELVAVNGETKSSHFQFQNLGSFYQYCSETSLSIQNSDRVAGSRLAFLFLFPTFKLISRSLKSNCILLGEQAIWDTVCHYPKPNPAAALPRTYMPNIDFSMQREPRFAQFCLTWMVLLSSYPSGKVFLLVFFVCLLLFSAKSKMISRPLGQPLLIVRVVHRSEKHPTAAAWLPSPGTPCQKIRPLLSGITQGKGQTLLGAWSWTWPRN